MKTLRIVLLAWAVGTPGCSAPPETPRDAWEGRAPGECADRADNDADGLFDCADPDCAGAPDCSGEDGPFVDCDAVPDRPPRGERIPGARGYHGLAFDTAGLLVGSDNSSLIRVDRDGDAEVWVPGMGVLQQMVFLPDGDLLVSGADGGLRRVTPDGGVEVVAPDLHAYSVLLGPDGGVYSGSTLGAADTAVTRTDLSTGESTVIARLDEGIGARALNFNRDFSTLYIGSAGGLGTGALFALAMDEDMEPEGDPELFADDLGLGWIDGIAVDACGQLYVPESRSLSLYRVSPYGEVETYVDWSAAEEGYGHDVVFGSGVGGWSAEALHLPLPYWDNQVKELRIGVPSRTWPGRVLNAP